MLNTKQLQHIQQRIEAKNLKKVVATEMFDHYASAIEHHMITGVSFEKAFQQAFDDMPLSVIQSINKQHTHTNIYVIMKKITPAAFLLCTIAFMIFSNVSSQENAWNMPVAKNDLTRMVSGFGYREHPIFKTKKLHTGMDFTAPKGTPVNAVQSGIVTNVETNDKGYGNMIELTHNDSTVSLYAHLDEIKVTLNQKIDANEMIGTVGNSGASSAPHLHFEIIKNGKKINPLTFIQASYIKNMRE